MAILDDPHEPRLRLDAAQTIKSTKSAQKRFLDDVIRVAGRPGQPPCITVCGVEVGHDESLEPSAVVIHGAACGVSMVGSTTAGRGQLPSSRKSSKQNSPIGGFPRWLHLRRQRLRRANPWQAQYRVFRAVLAEPDDSRCANWSCHVPRPNGVARCRIA